MIRSCELAAIKGWTKHCWIEVEHILSPQESHSCIGYFNWRVGLVKLENYSAVKKWPGTSFFVVSGKFGSILYIDERTK